MVSFRSTILATIVFPLAVVAAQAQQYKATNGEVTFFSSAMVEDITAENKKGSSVYDHTSGNIVFSIPISAFVFERTLMQEHFNDKYMESMKYPTATFKGKVSGLKEGNGWQEVLAEGDLTIHGVTCSVKQAGKMKFEAEKLYLDTKFIVKLKNYKVDIPRLMWQNIAEQVEVTLNFIYSPL